MTPVSRTSPVYSRALADEICARLSRGDSLRAICGDAAMPGERTVRDWVAQDRDGFAGRYHAITRRKGPESAYSEDLARRICDALVAGRPLQHICRAAGMPDHSTVLRWAQRDHNGFARDYALARALGFQAVADQILEIVDDARRDWRIGSKGRAVLNRDTISRARLRMRVRQETLARALPKGGGLWELPGALVSKKASCRETCRNTCRNPCRDPGGGPCRAQAMPLDFLPQRKK